MEDSVLVERWRVREVFEAEVVKDSSPGVPYAHFGRTNKDLISGVNFDFLCLSVVRRIKKLLSVDVEELLEMSAEEMVKQGYVDPVKIFIKQEPHKIAKINSGKLRIISNVSVVDQVVERLLFSAQNRLEIARWKTTPSKPGMGLNDDGLQELYATMQARWDLGKQLAESDISGWDWSVPGWMLLLEAKARIRLAGATTSGPWGHLVMARQICLSLSVFHLSDGQMWAQRTRGVQLSGSYTTSSSNSRMRVMLGYLAGVQWIMAMGDDDVEETEDGEPPNYLEWGFPMKDFIKCEEGRVGFCSMKFPGSWKGYPTQEYRSLYRLMSHSLAVHAQFPEYRAQFAMELRHHPQCDEILEKFDDFIARSSKSCQL